MRRTRAAAWWAVDLGLVALVGALIYGCLPGPGEGLLNRQCERHLELCERCRVLGLTPARMLAEDTPTPCLSFGAQEPPVYQLTPANEGQ